MCVLNVISLDMHFLLCTRCFLFISFFFLLNVRKKISTVKISSGAVAINVRCCHLALFLLLLLLLLLIFKRYDAQA